jgi:CarboxypepD_reg-like domain
MRLLIILTLYLTPLLATGQTRTITGKVIDEFEMTTVPQVRIQNRDTVELGTTDIKGNFKIELPAGTDQLMFSFLGFEWTTVKVPNNCDNLEIIMMLDGTYDFMTKKTVNRKRYKRFKKLNDRHQEAFEKGIFKSKAPCVTYTFNKY